MHFGFSWAHTYDELSILKAYIYIDKRLSHYSPLSTFVIDIPRRGVLITRKHNVELRNFIKLLLSRSLSAVVIAAAFLSISDDLHDDVDEFCE